MPLHAAVATVAAAPVVSRPRPARRRVLKHSVAAVQQQVRHSSLLRESEDRFRALVESVRDYAIFMLDREGLVESWNRGAEAIKGYTPDEIIGRSFALFYPPEDRESGKPHRLLAAAAHDGRIEDEGWRVRKDGTRFWADVVITALRDSTGQLTGFAKVTRDLSSRRSAEEELRRSEERFRLLVDAVEDYAVFMLDRDGRVATWNSGAQRIKGYTAAEILGQHVSCFRPPEDVAVGRCSAELEAAARKGRHEEEGWRVRKDGTRFWASVVISAVRSPSGELLGFAKVTRDLTDRRRLDEERLQRARAEEALRMRDEFLSIASHELKTPLTSVKIELYGLKERLEGHDERLSRKIERATRNADRLTRLVETLLDVSRIANGKLTLRAEEFDLARALSEVVDGLRASAAQSSCTVSFHTAGPVLGSWDRVRVEQVLMNLLSNAFKYGAGHPVSVAVARDGDEAVVEVKDQGPGVSDQDLERIFGRFERAASMRNHGGLGLGLYVSREIVRAHGGCIFVRKAEERGATFVVRLPRQPVVASPMLQPSWD